MSVAFVSVKEMCVFFAKGTKKGRIMEDVQMDPFKMHSHSPLIIKCIHLNVSPFFIYWLTLLFVRFRIMPDKIAVPNIEDPP